MGSFIDSNPAGVVDLIVVGEREENVDDVFAIIGTVIKCRSYFRLNNDECFRWASC